MNDCGDARQQERVRTDSKPRSSVYIPHGNNKIKKKKKRGESHRRRLPEGEKDFCRIETGAGGGSCLMFHSCSAESAEDVRMNNSKAQKQCLEVPRKTGWLDLCLQPELPPEDEAFAGPSKC